MSVDYTWNVTQMTCFKSANGEKNVINCIYWTLTGTEEYSGEFYTGSVYGSQAIPQDPVNLQCSCDGMTLEQAISLLKEAMGPEQVLIYEEAVAKQIQDQIDPPVVNPPLPWEVQQ